MNVNYGKIVNEVFKILKGLGYSVQLFSEDGDGPLSSPWVAKYIWTKPDGIMFEMPDEDSSTVKEIIIYKPDALDIDTFKNLFDRVKSIARIHGIEVTVRTFNKAITPKDFSFKPKAKQEEEIDSLEESVKSALVLPHLKDYLKKD